MKTILFSLFIFINFQASALDGEYTCHANQKVNYKSIASRLLKVSHQIDKIYELKKNGERDLALVQIQEALRDINLFRRSLIKTNFCYSLSDKVSYLKMQSLKFELKLILEQRDLKNRNSCQYFIEKLKNDIKGQRTIASKPHTQYIGISKTLRKTNLILSKRNCSLNQKSVLRALFDEQSSYLDVLYSKLKNK